VTTWSTVPLRTRLTVLCTALLVAGLGLTGAAALTYLQRSLVDQVDAQLAEWTPLLYREASRGLPTSRDTEVPTDYRVAYTTPDGAATSWWAPEPRQGRPDLPDMSTAAVAARQGQGFTVPDVTGDGRWRVRAFVLVEPLNGTPRGSVAVALPMTAADTTLARLRTAVLAITLTVGAVGAVCAWWGVRRSLRPLREIESTAAAIAGGDLSRRVPPAPETTEVGRLAASLNLMLGQIEQSCALRAASEERMRRFVADASHELRTPLATIRGYGELYRMGAIPAEEVPATVRRIEDSAVRMGSLVEDLLALARLDGSGEGERPLRSAPVDLVVLAADAAADLRALDPDRPVRLLPLTDGATMAGAVTTGDEDRLRQVLANLVGNAAQHTPPGTAVEIAVGRVPDDAGGASAVVEVRDHGPGIDPEHAERVFERFYRVDAGRGRESGGAGLGLAIVAAIVAAHRGDVGLRATPGGGTTVRVVLPAVDGVPAGDS
jgi:two-component system, OmpR family, sensor kinase